MLHDSTTIAVNGGDGGDGCVSFRREAHVPKGGPDGGDGGRGGDVVLVCSASLRDLASFRRRRRFDAGRGGHGKGSNRHGSDGETLEIDVPPGTSVALPEGGTVELLAAGDRLVVARGGKGGRGNAHFASATRQAPKFSERGVPGDRIEVSLRLKLIADVGLVGLPNAGKSSLLAAMTRARPKVASYPFTTLEPVLGTIEADDRQLVVADIPGLIEGASDGAGLGDEFLAHVERTRMLVHVLDLAPLDGSEPLANHATVESEIESYDARLAALPRIIALSKSDLVTPEEAELARSEWKARVGDEVEVLVTSSATGDGIAELSRLLVRTVPDVPPVVAGIPEGRTVYRPAAGRGFEVDRDPDGMWVVSGKGIERLVARFDIENDEAVAELERRLRTIGVMSALESEGFEPGDDVEIGGVLFELDPDSIDD